MQSLNHTLCHNHHVKNYSDVSIIYIVLFCIKMIIYVFLSPVLKNALYSFVTVLYSKEKTFLVRKVKVVKKNNLIVLLYAKYSLLLKTFPCKCFCTKLGFSPLRLYFTKVRSIRFLSFDTCHESSA